MSLRRGRLCPVCFEMRIIRSDQQTCSRDCSQQWQQFTQAQRKSRLNQAAQPDALELIASGALKEADVDAAFDEADHQVEAEKTDEMPEFLKRSLSENRIKPTED